MERIADDEVHIFDNYISNVPYVFLLWGVPLGRSNWYHITLSVYDASQLATIPELIGELWSSQIWSVKGIKSVLNQVAHIVTLSPDLTCPVMLVQFFGGVINNEPVELEFDEWITRH